MITHNHLYEEICSFENLLAAAHRAEHGKRMQDTIGRFRTDLEAELLRLRRELVDTNLHARSLPGNHHHPPETPDDQRRAVSRPGGASRGLQGGDAVV